MVGPQRAIGGVIVQCDPCSRPEMWRGWVLVTWRMWSAHRGWLVGLCMYVCIYLNFKCSHSPFSEHLMRRHDLIERNCCWDLYLNLNQVQLQFAFFCWRENSAFTEVRVVGLVITKSIKCSYHTSTRLWKGRGLRGSLLLFSIFTKWNSLKMWSDY